MSIKLDTFPSKCKIPKIKPSFKKGIKSEAERPIYLMYLTSKMSEKQIHNQTKDYLYRNKLLYIYQSAFRANHSTDTYLSQLTLTDMILNSAENGKHTLMILINLQMVFGTLEYKILSDKIKHMSCSDKATK